MSLLREAMDELDPAKSTTFIVQADMSCRMSMGMARVACKGVDIDGIGRFAIQLQCLALFPMGDHIRGEIVNTSVYPIFTLLYPTIIFYPSIPYYIKRFAICR